MPYITIKARRRLDQTPDPLDAGELNYVITMLLQNHLAQHGLSYAAINAVLGALEEAKADVYRRVALPYEEHKTPQRLRGGAELNDRLDKLLRRYPLQHGVSHATLDAMLGALEGAKAEFYRRVAVPYEERKAAENGDVYRVLAEQVAGGEPESEVT